MKAEDFFTRDDYLNKIESDLESNEDIARAKEWYEKKLYRGAHDYALGMRDKLYSDPSSAEYQRLTAYAAWCSYQLADKKKPETYQEPFALADAAAKDRVGVGCLATILASVPDYTDDGRLRQLGHDWPDNSQVINAILIRWSRTGEAFLSQTQAEKYISAVRESPVTDTSLTHGLHNAGRGLVNLEKFEAALQVFELARGRYEQSPDKNRNHLAALAYWESQAHEGNGDMEAAFASAERSVALWASQLEQQVTPNYLRNARDSLTRYVALGESLKKDLKSDLVDQLTTLLKASPK